MLNVLILSETADRSRYWEAALPRLAARGVTPTYVTLHPRGPIHERLEEEGFTTFSLDSQSSKTYPVAVMRLRSILKRGRFDIVHGSEAIPAVIAGTACSLATGMPKCLFHYHHTRVSAKQHRLSRLGVRLADGVMGVSRAAVAAAVENDGARSDRAWITHNGIETPREVTGEELAAMRERLGIRSGDLILSLVARFREEKGHLTALTAVHEIATGIDRGVHLVFPGSGPYEEHVRQAAVAVRNVNVHFPGHQDDIAPWFALADINLMPSYAEPFGLVAIEAMASGKPLIASGVDGLLEVVEDNVSGLLVPPRDAGALARAIERLLGDAGLYAKLSQGGIDRVKQHFTLERMVDGWIDCYNRALSM